MFTLLQSYEKLVLQDFRIHNAAKLVAINIYAFYMAVHTNQDCLNNLNSIKLKLVPCAALYLTNLTRKPNIVFFKAYPYECWVFGHYRCKKIFLQKIKELLFI